MSVQMRPGYHVEIVTPKKVVLHGMWMGPQKAKRVVIWVHGLGSTMYSKLPIADELVDKDTAVLSFNNRGHDKIASFPRGKRRGIGGSAHEVFIECVDDIEGAIRFAVAAGAKDIFLAGHSTGCQKSIYWAAKKGKGVKGIILLAPISDYSAEIMNTGVKKIARYVNTAKKLLRRGKGSQLVTSDARDWYMLADAQRFVSLYSGESEEEIFTYWAPERLPKALRSVPLPLLVLLAEKDEHRDRPAIRMADWFADHLKIGDRVIVVPKVPHSFKGGEKTVAQHMKKFMKEARQ